jgi:hypothetical protein
VVVAVVAAATTRRINKVVLAAVMKIRDETEVEVAAPRKEDMDAEVEVDVVEIHLDSATTSSARYARKKATPHTPLRGNSRSETDMLPSARLSAELD